jgi:hypothetical protein
VEPCRLFAPTLEYGALLVSGTPDCEFMSESIPSGTESTLVSVGPLEPFELDALLRTEGFKPLLDLKEWDVELWRTVADSSGNIPRELKKFCRVLEDDISKVTATKHERSVDDCADEEPPLKKLRSLDDISKVTATKHERSADDCADEEPPLKKLRSLVEGARSSNRADQVAKLDKALERDSSGIFKSRLSDSCRSIFIYGIPAEVNRTTLRVPDWIISKRMYDASHDQ